MVALIRKGESTSTWCVDSGATQHMCHQVGSFRAYIKYNDEQFVYLGDNMILYKIKG